MKPSELQEKTCHQFDCAIKTVIRHRAIDFYRAIRRSEKKEMPFAEIMDDLLNSIGTEDTYLRIMLQYLKFVEKKYQSKMNNWLVH